MLANCVLFIQTTQLHDVSNDLLEPAQSRRRRQREHASNLNAIDSVHVDVWLCFDTTVEH